MDFERLTVVIRRLALEAGDRIMEIYGDPEFEVRAKSDASPVTEADEAADRLISEGLAEAYPQMALVTEEQSDSHAQDVRTFLIVDPLDGTKEFISRNGEFTVNIALIEAGRPIAGVVYAPALRRIFWGEQAVGAAQGHLAVDDTVAWTPIAIRHCPAEGATVVASRSHRDAATDEYLKGVKVKSLCSAGSSLKFCLVASGEADLYPRFGRTMEWDTAAGHAVVAAAGGKVMTVDGQPLAYGKRQRGYDNPGFIVSA